MPRWAINDGVEILDVLGGQFDHIFLQVYALGETYYPSRYSISARKSDQWLNDFIEEAHRRNIRVSAWINLYYSWGYAPKGNNLAHPINRFPGWYVQDRTGRSIVDYSIDELEKKMIEGYYLAPGNQQVKHYLMSIIRELIDGHSFDGIHLDYVRYPGPGFIYDPAIRSQFMRAYCLDPINGTQEDFVARYGYEGSDDIQRRFRSLVADDLSLFIGQLGKAIKAIDPDIIVSAAVKPDHFLAYRDYYQNWPDWLKNGYIDQVCLMSYGRHIESVIDKALKASPDPGRIAVGIGVYLLSPEEVRSQVQLVRSKPCAGYVCFSYDQIKENRAYLDAVR